MRHNVKKGFTLVEVIVVLVILAILAAIMIPAMTGWIDKSKEKRLIIACRTCVNAAQTLIAEQYGIDQSRSAPPTAEVKELAGVPGEPSGIRLMDASAQVHYLTYHEGEDTVTYDADACSTGEYYFIGTGGGTTSGTMLSNMDTIKAEMDKQGKSIDSAAAAVYSKSQAAQLEAALKAKGINLSDLGANTWQYDKGVLYWADFDINSYKVGDKVLLMRYNSNTGNCNLWEATVREKQHPDADSGGAVYKVLGVNSKGVKSYETMTDATYEQMVSDYKAKSKDAKYQPST